MTCIDNNFCERVLCVVFGLISSSSLGEPGLLLYELVQLIASATHNAHFNLTEKLCISTDLSLGLGILGIK